jgi:ABC-2 type transport system permease protein
MSACRICALASVEITRLLRTRIAFTLLVVLPLLQVVLFGFAIRPDAQVSVAIAGPTPVAVARMAKEIEAERNMKIAVRAGPGEAEALVRAGRVSIGIEISEAYAAADARSPLGPVRVIVDATNPALTNAAAARAEAAYWRAVVARKVLADTGSSVRVERLFNAAGRSDWTFLMGLVGVTVMIAMVMLGALSLAREREGGTWETLAALPFRPSDVLVGKALPNVAVGTLQGLGVLVVAVVGFGLPARGSILALVALLPLLAAVHFSLGYAIAARSGTQLAALQGAVAFYLPAMLLSGFLYPFATLPHWAQAIGNAFPLTHFIRAANGALLRGDGAVTVLLHAVPIFLALAIAVLVALALQRRRIEQV